MSLWSLPPLYGVEGASETSADCDGRSSFAPSNISSAYHVVVDSRKLGGVERVVSKHARSASCSAHGHGEERKARLMCITRAFGWAY